MQSHILSLAAAALAFSNLALGQTSTDCDPLTNTTCPSDTALGKTITVDFTKGESSEFTLADATTISYGDDGAEFIITSDGLARTITSNNHIFFGKVEVALKAANGTGIVSSFVMESDDLDEIDWEWLGGNSTVVETNYFGKGNTTTYNRATYPTVDDPQDTDALSGKNFPQTPMRIKIGNWVGGAADAATGTVEWAGGYTDLDDAPFTMYVKNLTVQDYTTSGTMYTYGDETGDYTSIVISNSTSNSTSGSSSSSGSSSTTSTTGGTTYAKNSTVGTSSSATSSSTSTASSVSAGSMPDCDMVTFLLAGLGLELAFY